MYWIARFFFSIILKIFYNLKVIGKENIPKNTNFIVVANHCSFLDPIVIGVAIPKKIHFIALRNLYRIFWLRWFLKLMGSLPTGSASKISILLLLNNKNIGLFPEGTRSHDGKLKEFKTGTSLLAIKTGRPILPCAIIGTYEAFPRTAKFPKFFCSIKIKIGKPIYLLKEFEEQIDDLLLQEGIFKIRNSIKEMLND